MSVRRQQRTWITWLRPFREGRPISTRHKKVFWFSTVQEVAVQHALILQWITVTVEYNQTVIISTNESGDGKFEHSLDTYVYSNKDMTEKGVGHEYDNERKEARERLSD